MQMMLGAVFLLMRKVCGLFGGEAGNNKTHRGRRCGGFRWLWKVFWEEKRPTVSTEPGGGDAVENS
jgi:hypothetical protein